jgi:hypothetical protein
MKLNFMYINFTGCEYKENGIVCQRNNTNTTSLSLANFVGYVVGFLKVYKIRFVASFLPPRYPLKSKQYNP